MTYPIIQREMTVHLNNGNWYARPLDEPGILGPVDYGWHRHNLYPDSFYVEQVHRNLEDLPRLE